MKTSPGPKSHIDTPAHRVHGLSQLELDFRQQSLANLKPATSAAPRAPRAPAAPAAPALSAADLRPALKRASQLRVHLLSELAYDAIKQSEEEAIAKVAKEMSLERAL